MTTEIIVHQSVSPLLLLKKKCFLADSCTNSDTKSISISRLNYLFCRTWKLWWEKSTTADSDQITSVTQSCPTLCDPMNCSMPGLPVHHQLPEFTQTHVHQCYPAISSSVVPFSSCPQSLPASESFPMSQLFAWGGQSIGVSALALILPKKSRTDLL